MFVDSHIHLTHHLFDGEVPCIDSAKSDDRIIDKDRDALMNAIKDAGVEFCIEPGIELESNDKILQYAKKYPDFLYAAVGVHPTRAPQTKWKKRKELEELSNNPYVVAIGELGLDYHYERMKQHRIRQKMWFIWQLLLADRRQLPLILHIRLADEDAIRILRRYKKEFTVECAIALKVELRLQKYTQKSLGLCLVLVERFSRKIVRNLRKL